MGPLAIIVFLCSALSMASTDPQELLDIRQWMIRQESPSGSRRVAPEKIGRVISCIGHCQVYRGSSPHSVRWLSQLEEGDEVHTGPGSYLWMQLLDGTLVRLSPEGEVSLLEVNITTEKIFFQARLTRGQLYWLPRSANTLEPVEAAETDQIFLPVMDLAANLESFRRQQYQDLDEAGKASMISSAKPQGLAGQYQELNRLILANNPFREKITHEALLVVPNITLHITNQATHIFHIPVGETFFKFDPRPGTEVGEPKLKGTNKVARRGYQDATEESLGEGWWKVNDSGRDILPEVAPPSMLASSELLIRRIPTLLLVRERELAARRDFWININDPTKLAALGYQHMAPQAIDLHLRYLKEHTRRLETTHLRSLQRLLETPGHSYDERYFSHGLEAYFTHLKRRHSHAQTSVLDMSPLHYYGWMLLNARQNN